MPRCSTCIASDPIGPGLALSYRLVSRIRLFGAKLRGDGPPLLDIRVPRLFTPFLTRLAPLSRATGLRRLRIAIPAPRTCRVRLRAQPCPSTDDGEEARSAARRRRSCRGTGKSKRSQARLSEGVQIVARSLAGDGSPAAAAAKCNSGECEWIRGDNDGKARGRGRDRDTRSRSCRGSQGV